MSEAEFNKAVDKFVQEQNKQIGKTKALPVGMHPPHPGIGAFGYIFNEFINTDLIRHHAEAMGDRNPLWYSNDYAKGTIWGGIIAPPTITDSIAGSWARWPTVDIGKEAEKFIQIAQPSGPKFQWFQVIRPGDKFKVVDKYVGLVERIPKQPRPYRLFIDTMQRTYVNQRDETVAVVDCRYSVLAIPSDAENPMGVFAGAGRKRHKLTDEERDAIYRGYDTETRRGAEILYWDDVTMSEELKPLVAGPLSIWDTAAFFATCAGECGAFDLYWDTIKGDVGHLAHTWLDPEVNAWKSVGEGHFADGAAGTDAFTGGKAFGNGPQIDWVMCRTIYNWMGDHGFLKMFESQYRAMPITGDVFRIRGKVTNKSTEGDEHLVDLELSCENLDNLLIVPATAKVRLPSRAQS